jgi:hypothetical protein
MILCITAAITIKTVFNVLGTGLPHQSELCDYRCPTDYTYEGNVYRQRR